jgi:protein-L-isoaspartate(D-aspartate) O-methyltransferase
MHVTESNDELVETIRYRAGSYLGGGIRDERVLAAMRSIDRAAFLLPHSRGAAYCDEPVSIGYGQTCSQPSMVAFMHDKLELGPGMRVLEVGAGSGYAAAIAALLCAPGGRVIAAEILPELAAMAAANCTVALSRRPDAAVECSARTPRRPARARSLRQDFLSAGFPDPRSGTLS